MRKFVKKEITPEVIKTFLDGHDPQQRIVNLDYKYKNDFITVYYRDENDRRCSTEEPFYPFLWAKRSACQKLCFGDRTKVKQLLLENNIWVKDLDVTDSEGNVVEEIMDGYTYLFYATKPMSYAKFLDFFKKANNPVYSEKDTNNPYSQPVAKKDEKQYLTVTPKEQFLISTGKRFFKGYEDYDEPLRMIFDLETTGLNTKKDRIEQIGIRFNREVEYKGQKFREKIYKTEGNTEKEKDASELENILIFVRIIYTFKPDIITAHNGEEFDWEMLIGACDRLGFPLRELSAKYFDGQGIAKSEKEAILKLGGEIEKYRPTQVPKTTVTDSLHAVRRAQALDSNMLFSNLKYVTRYSKIVKNDRVYIPGDRISTVWNSTKIYAFCEEDGDWYELDENYKPNYIKPDPKKNIEYFQQELDRNREIVSLSGATESKYDDTATAESLYNDYLKSIDEENKNIRFKKGKNNGKFTLLVKNELLEGYKVVDGKYIAQRYLFDDLWECDKVEHRYNTPNFLICKMLPIPFDKCCTMGTAGQWKALLLAWSYENDLAIPPFTEKRKFTGGLSRLLRVGFVANVAKFDYNSLYPSIILTWGITDNKDLMHAMLAFLEHVLTEREKYKKLKKKAGKNADSIKVKLQNREYSTKEEGQKLNEEMKYWKQEESANDKKQLPLKILGNSFFGSYGCPPQFPWGNIDCAERTTCTGRMALRLMIYRFTQLGYKPIVGDTDGFNFQLPEESLYRYTEEHPYVSPGMSRETEEGKKYVGFRADVAEFNDMYMRDFHYGPNCTNKMGLGIDEVVSATINFSRKNYADYFPEEKFPEDVKMVGNTIKSKKMPEYISSFLEKGIRHLLREQGQNFIEEYYEYVDRIYNYKIPYKMIASKGKVKKSIAEYIADCNTLTKAGRPKSRQAWMELAILNDLKVSMGETIYYINTGKKKSESDIKKVTHFYSIDSETGKKVENKITLEKEWKKDNIDGKLAPKDKKFSLREFVIKHHPEIKVEDEVIFNCQLVPREVIESEFDVFCKEGEEYNVPKYIEQFNNRIKPLLVCFSPEIRDKILITNPDDRQYFTEEECKLCNGFPNKPGDQDTYEQLMTMEDKEIKFWMSHPEWKIPYLEECSMDWETIKADYIERMEREKQLGIEKVRTAFFETIENMSTDDFEKFEDGELPKSLLDIIELDTQTSNFVSKEYPDIVIGTIYDVLDARQYNNDLIEFEYDENA